MSETIYKCDVTSCFDPTAIPDSMCEKHAKLKWNICEGVGCIKYINKPMCRDCREKIMNTTRYQCVTLLCSGTTTTSGALCKTCRSKK